MLVGKKVILRTIQEQDLDTLYELASDLRNAGDYWSQNMASKHKSRKKFTETGFWEKDWGFLLITIPDETIVGEIVFFEAATNVGWYEIGYRIFKDENRGKGYTPEAVSLFVSYLFDTKSMDRIQASTATGNIASQRVLEKCGFKHEGTLRKAQLLHGRWEELQLYSIIREESSPLRELLG